MKTMTEAERAERIRALQERRATGSRPAASAADTAPTAELDAARAERIARLAERRAGAKVDDTLTLDPTPDQAARIQGLAARRARPSQDQGAAANAGPKPGRSGRRPHRAEASRIAAVGAGVSLTLALMTFMARTDAAAEEGDAVTEPSVGDLKVAAPQAPTDTAPSTLAPATSRFDVPVILTPIQVRTRVVRVPGPATSSRSTTSGGGGGAPVATGGGSVQATPPPPPPPAPAPATRSNGSK